MGLKQKKKKKERKSPLHFSLNYHLVDNVEK